MSIKDANSLYFLENAHIDFSNILLFFAVRISLSLNDLVFWRKTQITSTASTFINLLLLLPPLLLLLLLLLLPPLPHYYYYYYYYSPRSIYCT